MRNYNINTMNRPTRGTIVALVFAAQVLLGDYFAVAQLGDVADQRPLRLWTDAAVQTDPPQTNDAVMRSRLVRVDQSVLANMWQGGRVTFDLFDDRSLVGLVNRRTDRSSDRYTLSGRIEEKVNGDFIVSVNHGVLAGIIRAGVSGTYHIRLGPNGLHVVDQIDASLSFPCRVGDNQLGAIQNGIVGGGVAEGDTCDDGSVIDVLVVYTQAARDDAGGVSAIEAEIDLAIEDNNIAYVNSLVQTQMNLVYTWQLDIDDAEVTLGRLTDPNDGYMDTVHALRDLYGADQVALIRSGGGGVANGLWNLDPESEALAFCVNGLDSLPGMVVAHEIGHNMGCCHAIGDGGGCPPGGGLLFPFSNGHRFFGNSGTQWRTVMAYSPGQRIGHFSNPDVLFDGQPTGVPEGEPDAADNALTINLSAFTVSNWRCNDGICEDLNLPSDAEDCNMNGLPDACELALGLSADVNRNGILDECEFVLSHQKISAAEGGFINVLDNVDWFGSSAASLGDLDGDGIGDLAVGAFGDDDGGTDRGAVWVLFLNANGTVKTHQKISDTQGGFTGRLDDSDLVGWSVASLSDLDGDGVGDLALGALADDDGGTDRGAVWILFLNTDGTVKSHQKISDTRGGFFGILDDSDHFGSSVDSLGDLDGDGAGDLAVGAFGDDDGGTDRGAVWILFLNTDGTVKSHQKISDTQGGFTGILDGPDRFAISLASLGDLDGDGIGDLAVGAPGDDDGDTGRGAVWVLFLNPDGTVKSHQKISNTQGGFTGTLDGPDRFGGSIASLGDSDGDGVPDVAVGAPGDNDGGDARGAVWILYLNPDGTVESHRKISDTQGGFTGILDNSDLFGISLASLGDLDGDGVGDLAVGASGDDDGGSNRGATWVLFLDGVPQTPCPWDIDGNGTVGASDLLSLLAAWGVCDDPADCPADFDNTNVVGAADLLTLLANWGPCP